MFMFTNILHVFDYFSFIFMKTVTRFVKLISYQSANVTNTDIVQMWLINQIQIIVNMVSSKISNHIFTLSFYFFARYPCMNTTSASIVRIYFISFFIFNGFSLVYFTLSFWQYVHLNLNTTSKSTVSENFCYTIVYMGFNYHTVYPQFLLWCMERSWLTTPWVYWQEEKYNIVVQPKKPVRISCCVHECTIILVTRSPLTASEVFIQRRLKPQKTET